jgi:hypothetical protein
MTDDPDDPGEVELGDQLLQFRKERTGTDYDEPGRGRCGVHDSERPDEPRLVLLGRQAADGDEGGDIRTVHEFARPVRDIPRLRIGDGFRKINAGLPKDVSRVDQVEGGHKFLLRGKRRQ